MCPIEHDLMLDPVLVADGRSYERSAINKWFEQSDLSPMTGATLPNKSMTPNISLQQSIEEWRLKHFSIQRREDLTIEEQIGHGSSKTVFKGTLRRSGRHAVPVAVLKLRSGGSLHAEALKLIKLGRHVTLIRYIGLCDDNGEQLLITEYAQFGSLLRVFDMREEEHGDDDARRLPLSIAIQLLAQVCSGMEVLSSHGIVHRDLAARNILVGSYSQKEIKVKVCDFGLAVDANYHATGVTVMGGKIATRWSSPEVSERRKFSEKSDVWAWAITAWEVLTGGRLPFHRTADDETVAEYIETGQTAAKLGQPDGCNDELWALLLRCWEKKPANRPTFERLGAALEVLKQGGDTSAVVAALNTAPAAPMVPECEPSTQMQASRQALVESSSAPKHAFTDTLEEHPATEPELDPKRPRLDSRPSRSERSKPKFPPPTLVNFPPNKCEIYAPTSEGGAFKWYPVVGHQAGQLRVLDDGQVQSLSLRTRALVDKWNERGRSQMVRLTTGPSAGEAAAMDLPPAEASFADLPADLSADLQEFSQEPASTPSAWARPAVPCSASSDDLGASSIHTVATANPPSVEPPVGHAPIRVKLEQMEGSTARFEGAPKTKESMEREQHRAMFQSTRVASKHQSVGEPRYCFRAGCHTKCLTQSLGGCGTDDLRLAKRDYYTTFDGPKQIIVDGEERTTSERQLLIGEGELYYWGRADWNPWAPSYAGDNGMYLWPDFEDKLREQAKAMGWDGKEGRRGPQTQFHIFRQCTYTQFLQPYSAWHGEDAGSKKSSIYCGLYEVEEAGAGTITFREFFPYTQQACAKLVRTRTLCHPTQPRVLCTTPCSGARRADIPPSQQPQEGCGERERG